MSILVIGYGNTLRQDDGAGVALAERLVNGLQEQGVATQVLTVPQLAPELAVEIAAEGVQAVVFVDAAAGAEEDAIQVRRLDLDGASPSFGHQLDPAVLLRYAHLLAPQTPPAWLVTVPGVEFGHGETLSPQVQRLVATAEWVADYIQSEIEASLCTN